MNNTNAAAAAATAAATANAPRVVGIELNTRITTRQQDDNQEKKKRKEKKEKKEEADSEDDSDEDEFPVKFASPLIAQLSEWTSLISSPIDVQCRNFILAFASDFVDTNVFEFLMDAAARFASYQKAEGPLNPRHRPYQLNLDRFRRFVVNQDQEYRQRGVDHLLSSVIAHERDVANGRSRTDPSGQMPLDTSFGIYRISFTEYLLFTLRKTLEEYMTAQNELKQQTTATESSDVIERMKAKLAAYDEGVRSYNPPYPPIIDICTINFEQPRPSASRRFRTFINRTCIIQICMTLILLITMTGPGTIYVDASRPSPSDSSSFGVLQPVVGPTYGPSPKVDGTSIKSDPKPQSHSPSPLPSTSEVHPFTPLMDVYSLIACCVDESMRYSFFGGKESVASCGVNNMICASVHPSILVALKWAMTLPPSDEPNGASEMTKEEISNWKKMIKEQQQQAIKGDATRPNVKSQQQQQQQRPSTPLTKLQTSLTTSKHTPHLGTTSLSSSPPPSSSPIPALIESSASASVSDSSSSSSSSSSSMSIRNPYCHEELWPVWTNPSVPGAQPHPTMFYSFHPDVYALRPVSNYLRW